MPVPLKKDLFTSIASIRVFYPAGNRQFNLLSLWWSRACVKLGSLISCTGALEVIRDTMVSYLIWYQTSRACLHLDFLCRCSIDLLWYVELCHVVIWIPMLCLDVMLQLRLRKPPKSPLAVTKHTAGWSVYPWHVLHHHSHLEVLTHVHHHYDTRTLSKVLKYRSLQRRIKNELWSKSRCTRNEWLRVSAEAK